MVRSFRAFDPAHPSRTKFQRGRLSLYTGDWLNQGGLKSFKNRAAA
jgi:hypothetical protein